MVSLTNYYLFAIVADAPTVWKSVPAVETVRVVVCGASSRVVVGLPLCKSIPPASYRE
ncbi:hypothetical protein PISMIDRAFT_680922 [Pisolithus microcarpus 441]|uniref:Unplaced genomic scaffold scaffold_62, whole genome shotgun sequence n=1 Tax=Pisolithus microcarpus 441 TaxID=765257 RepID=A0A0C9Z6W8_9AGAM|nr:hypothetical protein PISMIDRAFT_680922 [Pisolithus microcarpus 441]